VEFELVLSLPREAETAHVTREVLDASLRVLGAADEVRDDIVIALGEATANVIQHADPSDEYEVRIQLYAGRCVIEVIDAGRGFDMAALDDAQADAQSIAERGRGLKIIEALAESFSIANRQRQGAMVRFEIPLAWQPDARGQEPAVPAVRAGPVDDQRDENAERAERAGNAGNTERAERGDQGETPDGTGAVSSPS
jgi:serine/threonine-protein kinase RsbW